MAERPRKKWGRREYVTGVATLVFVFGIITFLLGSGNPWGIQQILGLLAAVIGLVLMFVRLWLPPAPG